MTLSELETYTTWPQEPKLVVSSARAKLIRMLRSMWRNYPKSRLEIRKGGYGVWLDEKTYLRVSYSKHLTAEQQRDWLALLATWLVADPNKLLNQNTPQGG